jgi:hypothetical protein
LNGEFLVNIIECCGKNVVTRADGKKVHDLIVEHWNAAEKIKVDFGNVLVASVSFFDEIFGKLALEYGKNELTMKLKFENIQEFDRALLNDILISRLRQKELEVEHKVLQ